MAASTLMTPTHKNLLSEDGTHLTSDYSNTVFKFDMHQLEIEKISLKQQ